MLSQSVGVSFPCRQQRESSFFFFFFFFLWVSNWIHALYDCSSIFVYIYIAMRKKHMYIYIYIILILKASSDLFAVKTRGHLIHTTRWWFQIFFIFTPIWGRFPIWLYNNGLKPPTSSEWYTSCLAKKGHLQWQQRIIRLPSKHLKTPCCCIFPLNQPPKKRQKRCGVRGCCCLRHSVGGTFVLGDVDVDGFFGNLQMNLGGS